MREATTPSPLPTPAHADGIERAHGFGVILLCFFLSGATGLVYQVLWLRMLGLVLGQTVYAITAVLAAFMAGLALGSFLFARPAARIRNLIRAYGWLEIGIGVYCAAIPALFWLASALYLWLHRRLSLSYDAFSFVQFLLVFLLLLVPTTLMGGTLPVLSQAFVKRETGVGRAVGALYAVNTFGAVVGVILAGYVLLPQLGNRLTIAIAAAANLAVGALAIYYGGRSSRGLLTSDASSPPGSGRVALKGGAVAMPTGDAPSRLGVWLIAAALGVSGAVSMVYEVAWTRALALVIGSSTYAFTSMLVAFLVGIAGGSALYSWSRGMRRASVMDFATLQIGIALSVTATVALFERMPELFLFALKWSQSPGFVQVLQFAISAGSLLLTTLFIGATFPCAVAAATRGQARIGQDVGQIYAVNTLGAIAGTILAGFVLIPVVGVQASIKVGVVANLAVAAVLLAWGPRRLRAWRWGGVILAAMAAVAVMVVVPRWDQRVMASGPAIYAKRYLGETDSKPLADRLGTQKVVYYRDGLSGTVAILESPDHVFLRVNGKTDASTGVDMSTQLLSGHLPMLVHPNPKSVLVIGLGSGVTAGAVAKWPIERLDVVEIEPAVVEASRFFAHVHGDVLKQPRVRTVIADGRNFLLTTPERYDVIISEPSNPWIGGLASLFSIEFFQAARQRLRPGGVMLQWVQGYNLMPGDLQMVVRTFRTVFPATTFWASLPGDFLLLGRVEPAPLALDQIKERYDANEGLRADLASIGVQAWPEILGFFTLGERDAAAFAAAAGLNTDDRLPLEFSAPRALYLDTTAQNLRLLQSFRRAELPDVTPGSDGALGRSQVQYWIGRGYARAGSWDAALLRFERALQLDPAHVPSALGAGQAALELGRPQTALDRAGQVLDREPQNADAQALAERAKAMLQSLRR